MTKSMTLAALVLATALVVACKPAESTTTTTETKSTTNSNAVPTVPASTEAGAAKQ